MESLKAHMIRETIDAMGEEAIDNFKKVVRMHLAKIAASQRDIAALQARLEAEKADLKALEFTSFKVDYP